MAELVASKAKESRYQQKAKIKTFRDALKIRLKHNAVKQREAFREVLECVEGWLKLTVCIPTGFERFSYGPVFF